MDRLFVLLGLLALLALVPARCGTEDAQPVFFSLLFPELMPEVGDIPWLSGWLVGAVGEATAL